MGNVDGGQQAQTFSLANHGQNYLSTDYSFTFEYTPAGWCVGREKVFPCPPQMGSTILLY